MTHRDIGDPEENFLLQQLDRNERERQRLEQQPPPVELPSSLEECVTEQQRLYAERSHQRPHNDMPELDAENISAAFGPLVRAVYGADPLASHGIILCALDPFQDRLRFYLHVQTSGGDALWFKRGDSAEAVTQLMLTARRRPPPPRITNNKASHRMRRSSRITYEDACVAAKVAPYYCTRCTASIPRSEVHAAIDGIVCERCAAEIT